MLAVVVAGHFGGVDVSAHRVMNDGSVWRLWLFVFCFMAVFESGWRTSAWVSEWIESKQVSA